MEASLKEKIEKRTKEVEEILYSYLPEEEGYQKTVISAMNYTMRAGGKRLRPMLMDETYRMFGGTDRALIEPFMAAIEMIHTYSLIHDDLAGSRQRRLPERKKDRPCGLRGGHGDSCGRRPFKLCL